MLITVIHPLYEITPGTGMRIWRECEKDSLFIFWRNLDSIQKQDTEVIVRQTGMVYQLVFKNDTDAQTAYDAMILGISSLP
jgi:hypothetical protein